MSLRIDFSRFKQLARDLARERKKDLAEVVNKGLATAIIGSNKYKGIIQLAPRASRAQIETDLRHNDLNVKLATQELRKQGFFSQYRPRFEIQRKIAEIANSRKKKRNRSRGYLAAGWLRPLRDLGVMRRGTRDTNYWPGGSAAKGYALRARPTTLIARAFSFSRGSEDVLPDVMQIAVNNAAQDMADYFVQKMDKLVKRLGA